MTSNFFVESTRKKYEILFLKESADLVSQLAAIKNSIIVVDQQIERLYPDLIVHLRQFTQVHGIPASEETKTLMGAEIVLNILQSCQADRATTVVIIGGGITQDVASFAAHIYYRGLKVIFVPTTLLAMCDSCIGGKCALNYHGYKNQLGAFHPPEKVYIWTGFLDSLPEDAIYSGYAEILKSMLIGGVEMYEALKAVITRDGFKNGNIQQHIYQSLMVKKKLIEEDEFDHGVRGLLNYGHTFGHSLELITAYEMPHGIAIARGMDIANYIAWQKGCLDEQLYLDVHHFVQNYFHCNMKPTVTVEGLCANAQKDKKNTNGKLNMILMEQIGKFRIEPILLDQHLNAIVHQYLQKNPFLYRIVEDRE